MAVGLTADVFTLGADGSYDGKWNGIDIVRAEAGVSSSISITAEANACHGLELELGARASAEAQATLSVFLQAGADVEAFAYASAVLRVAMAPDLFDKFGLVADVGVLAEAAVAGRLEIGLSIGQIKSLANALLADDDGTPSRIAAELFGYFLDELDIRAGVWGRVAASAMAHGHVKIYGSLAESSNAGFVIEAGGALGLEVGTGWDFFATTPLKDVNRFYSKSADRITRELVTVARAQLGPEHHYLIQVIDLCLPITLQCTFVLGQTTASELIAHSDRVVEPTLRAILEQLRGFVLRKLTEVAEKMLVDFSESLVHLISGGQYDQATQIEIRNKLESLVDTLTGIQQFDLDTLMKVIPDISDIGTLAFDEDETQLWRQPIAVAWCGLATIKALEEGASAFSGGAHVGSLGFIGSANLSEDEFSIPNAPMVVLDEMESQSGRRPSTVRFSDTVDYINSIGTFTLLDRYLPDIADLLQRFEDQLGISSGDFVSACLVGSFGGSLTSTELYTKLRDLLGNLIDDEIEQQLLPLLKSRLGEGEDARIYLEEVAEPSLLGCKNFVFEQLDKLVANNLGAVAVDSFRVGLSVLVYKVFARNLIVIGNILHGHALEQVSSQMGSASNEVASNITHPMVVAGSQITDVLTLGLAADHSEQRRAEATQRLISRLLKSAEVIFGPDIWTPDRKKAVRRLCLETLSVDDAGVDYRADSNTLEHAFAAIAECNHLPNHQAMIGLGEVLSDIILDQIMIVFEEIMPALEEFYQAIAYSAASAIHDRGVELFKSAEKAWQNAQRIVDRLKKEMTEFLNDARKAAEDAVKTTAKILKRLSRAAERNRILDEIESDARAVIRRSVRNSTPGWNNLPAQVQNSMLAVPLAAFNTAFSVARAPIGEGLRITGDLSNDIERSISRASSSDKAVKAVIRTVTSNIESAISAQLSQFGVALPEQISPDHITDVVKKVLITEQIEAWIEDAYTHFENAAKLERKAEQAQNKTDRAVADSKQHHNRYQELNTGSVGILFSSPVAGRRSPRRPQVFENRVPVKIILRHARYAFVKQGREQRVIFTLNGVPQNFNVNAWSEARGSLTLNTTLSLPAPGLRNGLNIIECSYSDGRQTLLRRTSRFILKASEPQTARIGVRTRPPGRR